MYEIGKVYVWQNLVGPHAHFNGQETTVTGPPRRIYWLDGKWYTAQPTDTQHPGYLVTCAKAGDLRRKDPPSGEQSTMDLFKERIYGHETV